MGILEDLSAVGTQQSIVYRNPSPKQCFGRLERRKVQVSETETYPQGKIKTLTLKRTRRKI